MSSSDFHIVDGRLMHRLMSRIGLDGSHGARAAVLAAVTWAPLLVLSALRGVALGDQVRVPFLLDIAAYARFLIAVPLMVLAEPFVDHMLRLTVRQFTESGLIKEDERPEFESAVGEMVRRIDSVLPEILLLALSFIGSLSFGRNSPAGLSTWHERVWWYNLVSLPIYQFLIYRWLWRFAIWSAFLWRVSKLDLQIVATHPDQRGGLAFLAVGQASFQLVVFSASIVFAGIIAVSVIFGGIPLLEYRIVAAVVVFLLVLLFIGPLFLFTPKLIRLKINSILDYGVLAARYTQSFDRKWVRKEPFEEDKLLGSPDIQSLADLITSYGSVHDMKVTPFGLKLLLAFLFSALIPLLPLVFLAVPAKDVALAVLRILRSILG